MSEVRSWWKACDGRFMCRTSIPGRTPGLVSGQPHSPHAGRVCLDEGFTDGASAGKGTAGKTPNCMSGRSESPSSGEEYWPATCQRGWNLAGACPVLPCCQIRWSDKHRVSLGPWQCIPKESRGEHCFAVYDSRTSANGHDSHVVGRTAATATTIRPSSVPPQIKFDPSQFRKG